MKKQIISLNLLKFLTMLLIVNSHADVLYPQNLSFMASGGSIGNELFFLISGYLFVVKSDVKTDFKNRFIRLYLPTYIMIAIIIFVCELDLDSINNVIREFIWPTHFWFVGAVFLYSIILCFLVKKSRIEDRCLFLVFVSVVFAVDVLIYVFFIQEKSTWVVENAYIGIVPFRSIYSLISFVLGYYIKCNKDSFVAQHNKSFIHKIVTVFAIAFFLGFYGFKFLLNKGIVPMKWQIISHPLTVICALFIFLTFVMMDLNSKLDGTRLGNGINFLSSLSLESYLVQFVIITGLSPLLIPFPVNLLVCIILVFVAAELLHLITNKVHRLLQH